MRLVHQLRPADARAPRQPQLSLTREDARWFVLAGMDGVTVPTVDGRRVTYRKRDSKVFRSMMVQRRRTALPLRNSVADLVGSGCSTVDGATKSLR